jgi:hypothetical protein
VFVCLPKYSVLPRPDDPKQKTHHQYHYCPSLGWPGEQPVSHRTALNQTRIHNVNQSRLYPYCLAAIFRCTIDEQRMLNGERSTDPDNNWPAICIRQKIAERAVIDMARGLCAEDSRTQSSLWIEILSRQNSFTYVQLHNAVTLEDATTTTSALRTMIAKGGAVMRQWVKWLSTGWSHKSPLLTSFRVISSCSLQRPAPHDVRVPFS